MDRQEFVEAVIAELSLKDMSLPPERAKQRSPQVLADALCTYDYASPSENEVLELAHSIRCLSSCGEGKKLLQLRLTRKYWNGLLYLSDKGGSMTASHAEAVAELSATSIVHLVEHLLRLPHKELSEYLGKYEPLSLTALERESEKECKHGHMGPGPPLDVPVDTVPMATSGEAVVCEEVEASTPDDDNFVYEGDIHIEEDNTYNFHSDSVLNCDYLAPSCGEKNSEELVECLSDMLSIINYSMIAGLSSQRWSSLKLTESISRIMAMFLGRSESPVGILCSSGTKETTTTQYLWEYWPTYAYILRDRVEHRAQDASLCLPPLVTLVQNQLLPQPHIFPTSKRVITAETIVGLSALASLCRTATRETVSASTSYSKAIQIYHRQIDALLPAIVDCLDVVLESDGQRCVLGNLLTIIGFYAGICHDGTASSYPSAGLYKACIHRRLLQLVLKTRATNRSVWRLLLILAAQSPDVASYIARSALIQLLTDVVVEAFPSEGLAWMAILAHAEMNCLPLSSQASGFQDATSLISMARKSIERMPLSPSVLLDGLQALHCARHRLCPWLSSGMVIPATIAETLREALNDATADSNSELSSADAIPLQDDVPYVDGQEDKLKLQQAKRSADMARCRRYLKDLLDLAPSKGD